MEAIKTVEDFRKFIDLNYSRIYSNAIKAEDLSKDDEWMKEDEWEDVYRKEVVKKMESYKIGDVW